MIDDKTINLPLIIEFQNTKSDYRYFNRRHYLNNSWWKYFIASIILSFGIDKISGSKDISLYAILIYTLTVLVIIHIFIIMGWYNFIGQKKLFVPKVFTFDREEIELDLGFEVIKVRWLYFDKFEETSKYINLYVSKNRAFIVPKSQIEPTKLTQLISLLQANIK